MLTQRHCTLPALFDKRFVVGKYYLTTTNRYLPHAQWNSKHFVRDIRHDTACDTAMGFTFLHEFSVSFGLLLTMLPRFVFCDGISSKNFVVPETCRNYCPGPENATGTCYAKSKIKCTAECILRTGCIYLSYYPTSGLCYFYSLAPQKMFYDYDCTLMVVSFQK